MVVFGPRKIVGHAGYALDVAVLAFIVFFVVGGHAEAARGSRVASVVVSCVCVVPKVLSFVLVAPRVVLRARAPIVVLGALVYHRVLD